MIGLLIGQGGVINVTTGSSESLYMGVIIPAHMVPLNYYSLRTQLEKELVALTLGNPGGETTTPYLS